LSAFLILSMSFSSKLAEKPFKARLSNTWRWLASWSLLSRHFRTWNLRSSVAETDSSFSGFHALPFLRSLTFGIGSFRFLCYFWSSFFSTFMLRSRIWTRNPARTKEHECNAMQCNAMQCNAIKCIASCINASIFNKERSECSIWQGQCLDQELGESFAWPNKTIEMIEMIDVWRILKLLVSVSNMSSAVLSPVASNRKGIFVSGENRQHTWKRICHRLIPWRNHSEKVLCNSVSCGPLYYGPEWISVSQGWKTLRCQYSPCVSEMLPSLLHQGTSPGIWGLQRSFCTSADKVRICLGVEGGQKLMRFHGHLRCYPSKWNMSHINRDSIYVPCNETIKASAEKFAVSLDSSS
jgi:hypothetical protein